MDFESFEQRVSEEMERVYGLSWAMANGDAEPLERALADGETPAEFVERFGEKYDLVPLPESSSW